MSLDNELLMLAGEDEDDTKLSSPPRRKRSSPPTSISPSKKRARPATLKKPSKKRAKHSDEEEDESSALSDVPSEVSSQTDPDEPMDLGSSSEEEDNVQDLYPLEGKYKDHADMDYLLAMDEIDREAILAERATQIDRANQDRHLRNILKARNAANKSNNLSASASAAARRSTRTKSAPKKNEESSKRGQLDELKRAREERSRNVGSGKQSTGDEEGGSRRRSTAGDDDDKAGFVDDLYRKEDLREIELSDINRARIGRTGLGKLCDYPTFEDVVTDCFVRVSLYDREKEVTVYRIAQIKGFTTGKMYSMLDGRRRTDQHLQVCQGKAEKTFPMDMMSDGPITEQELARFKKQLECDKVPLPSLSFVQKKAQELRNLDSRSLTTEEVDAIIVKRNKGKVDAVNLVLRRGQLRNARETAMANGDTAEVDRIDKELQLLEDQKRKPVGRPENQLDRLAKINAENRKRNTAEIRKAEIEEKRAARLAAEQAGGVMNPFMRVKTKAKFRHESFESKRKNVEDVSTPADSQDSSKSATPKPVGANGVGVMVPGVKRGRKGGIDDIIASIDLKIEIDI
ncbi:RNA polymerase-associated protein rtf1 [Rhizina undulata]